MTTRDDIELAGLTEGERVMWRFREAVKNEEMLSVADIRFLADAFGQILSGTPPKKALKIEKPQGRKEKTVEAADKELGIAMMVRRLVRERKIKPSDAKRIVFQKTKIPERTIARYCAGHARDAKALDALIVAHPKRHKQLAELVNDFGEGVKKISATTVDGWADTLENGTFIEGYDLTTKIKLILGKK